MGRLGAAVAGTDPRSTGGHPKQSTEKKKGDSKMNKFRFTINMLAIAIFTLAFASIAQAQASRTWVSGVGDDANPCSRTAPCKTFAGSISKTAVNGEINCLDPGGFGAVTITKSITIDCHEVFASILNAGTNGINIPFDNFTAVGETKRTVRLRNINFNGFVTGLVGINITGTSNTAGGGKVYVEDCMIDGEQSGNGNGIRDTRTAGGFLSISNTTVRDMSGAGILIRPASGSTTIFAVITNSRVYATAGPALSVGSAAAVSVDKSIFSGSATGVFADSNGGGTTNISLDSCQITSNGTGLNASTGSTDILVSNSLLVGNSTLATTAGGGVINSYGNNMTGGAIFGTGVLQR